MNDMAKKTTGQRSICRYCGRQCTVKPDVGNVCRECKDVSLLIEAERLLYLAYQAFSTLKRRGFPLAEDWPEEADEAYEAIGRFLFPDA